MWLKRTRPRKEDDGRRKEEGTIRGGVYTLEYVGLWRVLGRSEASSLSNTSNSEAGAVGWKMANLISVTGQKSADCPISTWVGRIGTSSSRVESLMETEA